MAFPPHDTPPISRYNGVSVINPLQEPINIKCVLLGDSGVGKTSLVVSYTSNGYPSDHQPSALDTFCVEVNADNHPVQLHICDVGGGDEASSLRHLSYPDAHVILLCFSVVKPESFRALRDRWILELAESCLILNPTVQRLVALKRPNSITENKCRLEESIPKPPISKVRICAASSRNAKQSGTDSAPGPALLLVGCACDLRNDIGRLLELSKRGEEPVDKQMAEHLAAEVGAEAYVECSALTQKNLKTVFDLAIWCGLRVASFGVPIRQTRHVNCLDNGNGSILPQNSSGSYARRHPNDFVQPNHTAFRSPGKSTPSSKSDKSVWRRFLCMR